MISTSSYFNSQDIHKSPQQHTNPYKVKSRTIVSTDKSCEMQSAVNIQESWRLRQLQRLTESDKQSLKYQKKGRRVNKRK